jgi:hypothetical protein
MFYKIDILIVKITLLIITKCRVGARQTATSMELLPTIIVGVGVLVLEILSTTIRR